MNFVDAGVLIEKWHMSGTQNLTGHEMSVIENLVSVINVKDGIIRFLQKVGHHDNNDKNGQNNDKKSDDHQG